MARKKKRSQDLGLLSSKFIVKVPKQRARRRRPSADQKENENRFRDAAKYGSDCMKIPERKELYRRGITKSKNSAYTVACTDYQNPPIIHYIKVTDYGPSGSTIQIKATDDFEVASVRITISDADGKVIEEGAALRTRLKRQMWKYETKVISKASRGTEIKAMAADHAENQTEEHVVIE